MKLREYMLKLLQEAIKASNLTQTAIAKKAGVGPSEISRIVNGKLEPSTEYCIRILFSLGYSIEVQAGGQIVVNRNG